MSKTRSGLPDPKRSAIARANRAKRQGLTAEGRERLRQSALLHQPWRFSTGPTTAAGKARVAQNGRKRQLGPFSVRQIKANLVDIKDLLLEMQESRSMVGNRLR
jgi:hypothetical protein